MAPPRGFPASEFHTRTGRAQELMKAADLDALLLTTEAEIRYFTGFLTQFWESPTRPWFLVVPVSGEPVAVIPAIGANLMGKTWISDIRTWSAPAPEDDGISLLASALRELAGPAGRIGVPMGHETHLRMPLTGFARVSAAIKPLQFVDATATIRTLHGVKSEAEIAKIAAACAIAGRAFGAMAEIARPGKPLSKVFRDFQIALLEAGADRVPYLAGGAGQGGYGDVISPPGDDPLQPGDILMLDTGAVLDGYFCDFDRNYAIGHADDEARRAYHRLHEATEKGLAAARPGAMAADLYHAMANVIGKTGDVGRLGHGLGMRLTEWPSLIAADETVLEPGMVLTLEPGIEVAPGRIMVHEEDIVISEDGARLLSERAPPDLPVLG